MQEITINCPYCGAEYLPSEIFVPDGFFGRPTDIEKTSDGKIVLYLGTGMDLREEYKCDCCDKKFHIQTSVKFNVTELEPKLNFDEDYSTSLKVKKYSLFED